MRTAPLSRWRRANLLLRAVWRRYWWVVLSGFAVLSFSLAYLGADEKLHGFARVSAAVRVFPLGLGVQPEDPESWMLQVARPLAWFVVAYAAVRATFLLFGERFQEFRARRARGHVIVCGLGAKGQALTESLLRGRKVVALDLDPGPEAQRLRDHGAIVLRRDATDPESLRAAGISGAESLVAACGPDAANAQIAAAALSLARGRASRPLRTFAHIGDPRLYTFLLRHALSSKGARVEFFNVYEQGARDLVNAMRPAGAPEPEAALIVGAGDLGLAVASLVARRSLKHEAERQGRPFRLHIVDLDANSKARLLVERHTRIEDACVPVAHEMDVASPAFDHLLERSPGLADVSVAYVCFEDENLAISTTLNLLSQAKGRFPVVARVARRTSGLVALLEAADGGDRDSALFRPLGLAETCRGDVVLEGIRGQLARRVHEVYRSGSPGGPYDVPWDELPADGRDRNLRHAEAIASQLEAVGYQLAPLIDWGRPLTVLEEAEVDQMAEVEHERWMAERLDDGWQYGPLRDDGARVHPDLVRWVDLPTDRQDINRRLVSERPRMLADVGIGLYRVELPPETRA